MEKEKCTHVYTRHGEFHVEFAALQELDAKSKAEQNTECLSIFYSRVQMFECPLALLLNPFFCMIISLCLFLSVKFTALHYQTILQDFNIFTIETLSLEVIFQTALLQGHVLMKLFSKCELKFLTYDRDRVISEFFL